MDADEGCARPRREEVAPPERGVGKDREEGRGDQGELLLSELVDRQPLAEDAAGGEVRADRLEVLAAVHGADPRSPGNELIRDDHVVELWSGPQVVATVLHDEPRAGIPVHPAIGGAPELAAERAQTLGASGQIEEGIAGVRAAFDAAPDSARLHHVLALLLFQLGRADEGARAVDRALELDSADLRPLRTRAEFRAASGRLDGARRDCEAYLARLPDDAAVHYILGAVHQKAGRADEAIAAYQRAAALDERAVAPRNNLAMLLAERGDLDAGRTLSFLITKPALQKSS